MKQIRELQRLLGRKTAEVVEILREAVECGRGKIVDRRKMPVVETIWRLSLDFMSY